MVENEKETIRIRITVPIINLLSSINNLRPYAVMIANIGRVYNKYRCMIKFIEANNMAAIKKALSRIRMKSCESNLRL